MSKKLLKVQTVAEKLGEYRLFHLILTGEGAA
jgi:hypothetical protein